MQHDMIMAFKILTLLSNILMATIKTTMFPKKGSFVLYHYINFICSPKTSAAVYSDLHFVSESHIVSPLTRHFLNFYNTAITAMCFRK